MSILSKLVSFAFLAPALFTSPREKFMAKAKTKARRKRPAAPKARAASRSTRSAKQARSKQARRSISAEKAAAKLALLKAGRTALALAKQGTQRATNAGRDVLARAARSAAGGLQSAARGIGDTGAAALESVADKVMPVPNK